MILLGPDDAAELPSGYAITLPTVWSQTVAATDAAVNTNLTLSAWEQGGQGCVHA